MAELPPFAPFPNGDLRGRLSRQEWESLCQAWTLLGRAYLNLDEEAFKSRTGSDDESLIVFLSSFMQGAAANNTSSTDTPNLPSPSLLNVVYHLTARLVGTPSSASSITSFEFLADLAKVFPKKHAAPLLSKAFAAHSSRIEASLATLKKLLILHLDSGIKGDLKLVEAQLLRLDPLLHASTQACTFFLAGSDFVDSLVVGFRVMNPPLRKAIVTTLYLCLVGLAEARPPMWGMLSDQLYTLKDAAESHKKGLLNANDSLVPELVTTTPLLKLLTRRAEADASLTTSLKARISALEGFKKGAMIRPKRLIKRKVDKGKGRMTQEDVNTDMHVHLMSQITQIQDLFPDLGAGFVSRCLDEYGGDVEQVVANLLGETLPSHLAKADRSEPLTTRENIHIQPDLAPRPTPPQLPTRRNIHDEGDIDTLITDINNVSFGKDPGKTADDLLKDKSTAPNRAAILSALAAFDPDDDERDDTYDAADVGGTVDSSNQEADGVSDGIEEMLFRAYQMDEKLFGRDAATRRSGPRLSLRKETGMTDEAIEGWAVVLARNPQQRRRLEAKYAFSGQQSQLERTAWRASPAGSGAEESDPDGGPARGGSARGGRGRGNASNRGGGRGRGGGNVAGQAGDKGTDAARKNKEANKGSRANHNRRDARAKKMARGGFAG